MKRKIYIILFIGFVILAGLSSYKLIDDQVDYKSATDYYQSFADSWVKYNPPVESQDAPAETKASVQNKGSVEIEASDRTAASGETTTPAEIVAPSNNVVSAETVSSTGNEASDETALSGKTATPAKTVAPSNNVASVETVSLTDTEAFVETTAVSETESDNAGDPALTSRPPETEAEPKLSSEISETAETGVQPAATLVPFNKIVVPKVAKETPSFTTDQPPISVDFDELQQMNPEIVGWIYCEDTPINYPVLQGKNNEKYLHYQPDGKTSKNGSIFIDYQCEPDFSSDNTLVYGHNRKNGMFASLPKYGYQSYYDAHPVMWLLTPDQNYKVELFAGFPVRANSWVYEIVLTVDKFKAEFVDQCLKSSGFRTENEPDPNSRLLTLSTCHYDGTADARFVVIGALIPCIQE